MAFTAGTRVTAADFVSNAGATALADDTAAAVGVWEQWGTATIVFPKPGVAVKCRALLTGRIVNATDADTNAGTRVLISIDGGTSFTAGNAPAANVGTSVGTRSTVNAACYVEGTPTGDIVVKAEFNTSDITISFQDGYILADIFPL